MRFLTLALLFTGCTGSDDKDSSSDPTDETTDEEVTDTGGAVDTDTDIPEDANFYGHVYDDAGAPMKNARILFCRGSACRTEKTDVNGVFHFVSLAPGPGSFEVAPTEGSVYSTVFAPLDIPSDQTYTIDVDLVKHEPVVPLPSTAAELEVVPGLFLTVGQDTLQPPILEAQATEVWGADATAQPPPISVPGTLVKAWYLDPFDHTSASGIAVRIVPDWTVDGDYELWLSSYETSAWEKVGDLTQDGASLVTTGKLTHLSTLVVVENGD